MNVTLLLCDAAESVNGKLYILGGGWSQLLLADYPAAMALAIKLEIPWHEANDEHRVVGRLVDADRAEQVELPLAPENEMVPGRPGAVVETGRPPGLSPGTAIDAPLVFKFQGLPLPAGSYVWEVEVDGEVGAGAAIRVGPPQR